MSKLKVGDRVKWNKSGEKKVSESGNNCDAWAPASHPKYYLVIKYIGSGMSGEFQYSAYDAKTNEHYASCSGHKLEEEDFTLLNNSKNMNIKDKFVTVFKSEPEKSFRLKGITDGDDFLTEDGEKVFLGYLLKKHGAEFKAEVVDNLSEEDED